MITTPEKNTMPRVRVTTSAELLAAVPRLLGFTPEDSMVVIGTEPPRDRVKLAMRYDLPNPPDPDDAADIAAHAAAIFSEQGITSVLAVGYGPAHLVTPVADALHTTLGLPLRDVLRVEGGRYWSYMCTDESCCPAEGTPFDVTATELTDTPLADRAALAATVAPLGGIAAESMRQATRRAEQHIAQLLVKVRKSGRLAEARHVIAAEGLADVGAMIDAYRQGSNVITDETTARIMVALRDLRVRDDAWARMEPEHKDAHLRLWTDVVRRAQPGYVAAPAALLAFVAWQSGDGALANVALDRAFADDPRYSMAQLLRQVITAGAPPSLARLPMTPEEVAASYDDAEADDRSGVKS